MNTVIKIIIAGVIGTAAIIIAKLINLDISALAVGMICYHLTDHALDNK